MFVEPVLTLKDCNMRKLAVVALGGNALLRGNEQGTIEQQEANTTATLEKPGLLNKRWV